MNCKGEFIFKTLTHRPAGTFKGSNGIDINYPSAYILKVDELLENGDIQERKFKLPEKSKLVDDFRVLDAYEKIILTFVLNIYSSRITLELTGVSHSLDDDN